jgi:hypothetical protein
MESEAIITIPFYGMYRVPIYPAACTLDLSFFEVADVVYDVLNAKVWFAANAPDRIRNKTEDIGRWVPLSTAHERMERLELCNNFKPSMLKRYPNSVYVDHNLDMELWRTP